MLSLISRALNYIDKIKILKETVEVSLCTLKTLFLIVYYVNTQVSLMVSSICRLKFALKSVNGSLCMYISRPRSVMIVHGAFCLIWLIILSTTEMSLYFSAILTMICLKTVFFATCATFIISRIWCVVLLASQVKLRRCWMFLTNKPHSFCHYMNFDTGLSDFHNLTGVVAPESNYDLRNKSRLLQPKFNTYKYGYNSFIYLGSKLWNSLPSHLKHIDDLYNFRREIYKWCLSDRVIIIIGQLDL